MSAAHEMIPLAEAKMPEMIRKPRKAITRLAADQSLAKPREFTPGEAKEIAEKGYHKLLKEGMSREFAERYRNEIEEMLREPLGW